MNRLFALVLGVALVVVAKPVGAGGPKCQDIPLRVMFYDNAIITDVPSTSTPSAIRSDGGEYAATIKVCSGTNDAVINLAGTGRTFIFVFPSPLGGSTIEDVPTWVPSSPLGLSVSGLINVRSITFSQGPFETHVGSTFAVPGDRATYRLGWKGDSPGFPDAPNNTDDERTASDNTPLRSSPAVVYPTYPSVCGTGSMPSWIVRGTRANYPGTDMQVATLHKQASNPRGADVHEGQYSMPFEMFIQALACFPYPPN